MKTALCHMLGIEYPIIAAPMGPDLTGPESVAAVSNAGGLGILQAQFCPPPLFRREIHRVRALTNRPFGVNLLLHFPIEDHVAVCLEERVPVLSLYWGDPTPYVERAHAAGIRVFHQVGSVSDAQRAADSGVDVIIAQGVEAGGHVAGEVSTLALVPRGVDAVSPRPRFDRRLGARRTGRRVRHAFSGQLRIARSPAQQAEIAGGERGGHGSDHPLRSRLAERPHRTLRTAFVRQWLGREGRGQESRPDEPVVGRTVIAGQPMPVLRFMGFPPNADASGDIDSMDLLAGQGVGLVREVVSAGQIVRELVAEARQIVSERLAGLLADKG
jgi:nitronate monooxygenase